MLSIYVITLPLYYISKVMAKNHDMDKSPTALLWAVVGIIMKKYFILLACIRNYIGVTTG